MLAEPLPFHLESQHRFQESVSGIVFSGSGNANGKNILTFASLTCAEGEGWRRWEGRTVKDCVLYTRNNVHFGYGSKQS